MPSVQFPAGYAVSVSGGAVLSAPNDPQLRIASCPGANSIDVVVRPGAAVQGPIVAPGPGGSRRAPAHRCVNRRGLRLRLHHRRGARIVRVQVRIGGRVVRSRRGRNLRAVSVPRPPRSRLVIRIRTTDSRGRRRNIVRSYNGCGKVRAQRRRGAHRRGQ